MAMSEPSSGGAYLDELSDFSETGLSGYGSEWDGDFALKPLGEVRSPPLLEEEEDLEEEVVDLQSIVQEKGANGLLENLERRPQMLQATMEILCSGDQVNAVSLNPTRVLRALVPAILGEKKCSDINPNVVRLTCSLLGILAFCDTNKSSIVDEGGARVIVSFIRGFLPQNEEAPLFEFNEQLICLCSETLCTLASVYDTDNRLRKGIEKDGAVEAIVPAMQQGINRKGKSDLQACGCRLLQLLSFSESSKSRIVECDGIDAIVSALEQFSKNSCDVIYYACGALYLLIFQLENLANTKPELGERTACALASVLGLSTPTKETRAHTLTVLTALVINEKLFESSIASLVVKERVVQAIVRIITELTDDGEVLADGIAVLHHILVENTDAQSLFLSVHSTTEDLKSVTNAVVAAMGESLGVMTTGATIQSQGAQIVALMSKALDQELRSPGLRDERADGEETVVASAGIIDDNHQEEQEDNNDDGGDMQEEEEEEEDEHEDDDEGSEYSLDSFIEEEILLDDGGDQELAEQDKDACRAVDTDIAVSQILPSSSRTSPENAETFCVEKKSNDVDAGGQEESELNDDKSNSKRVRNLTLSPLQNSFQEAPRDKDIGNFRRQQPLSINIANSNLERFHTPVKNDESWQQREKELESSLRTLQKDLKAAQDALRTMEKNSCLEMERRRTMLVASVQSRRRLHVAHKAALKWRTTCFKRRQELSAGELAKVIQSLEERSRDNQSLQNSYKELEAALRQASERNGDLQKQLDGTCNDTDRAFESQRLLLNDQFSSQIASLKNEDREKQARIHTLEEQIACLETKFAESESALELTTTRLEAQLQQERSKVRKLQGDLLEQSVQSAQQADRNKDLEAEVGALMGKLSQSEEEQARLSAKFAQATEDHERLENELEQVACRTGAVDSLQQRLSKERQERAALEGELASLRFDKVHSDDAFSKVEAAFSKVTQLESELRTSRLGLDQAGQDKERLRDQIEELEQRVYLCEADKRAAERKLDTVVSEKEDAMQQVLHKSEIIERLREKESSETEHFKNTIASLEIKLQESRQEFEEENRKKVEVVKEQLETEYRMIVKAMSTTRARLEFQLEESEKERARLVTQVYKLEAHMRDGGRKKQLRFHHGSKTNAPVSTLCIRGEHKEQLESNQESATSEDQRRENPLRVQAESPHTQPNSQKHVLQSLSQGETEKFSHLFHSLAPQGEPATVSQIDMFHFVREAKLVPKKFPRASLDVILASLSCSSKNLDFAHFLAVLGRLAVDLVEKKRVEPEARPLVALLEYPPLQQMLSFDPAYDPLGWSGPNSLPRNEMSTCLLSNTNRKEKGENNGKTENERLPTCQSRSKIWIAERKVLKDMFSCYSKKERLPQDQTCRSALDQRTQMYVLREAISLESMDRMGHDFDLLPCLYSRYEFRRIFNRFLGEENANQDAPPQKSLGFDYWIAMLDFIAVTKFADAAKEDITSDPSVAALLQWMDASNGKLKLRNRMRSGAVLRRFSVSSKFT